MVFRRVVSYSLGLVALEGGAAARGNFLLEEYAGREKYILA